MEGIIINNLDYPVLTVTTFLPLAGAFIILLIRMVCSGHYGCNIFCFAAYLQIFR